MPGSIRSGAQLFPLILVIFAPMEFSGSMIRAIGLEFRDSSPDRMLIKSCPAKMPEISLVVVPLLPVSSVESGADRPCRPLPCTRIRSGVFSISMPILRKQLIVDRQSAPCRKFVISVVPLASAPNITERWEMDLSPGMITLPFNPVDGAVIVASFIVCYPFC